MSELRFLIVEGNLPAARETHRLTYGLTPGESYAQTVTSLAPRAICDVAFPTDEGANLPDPSGLGSYDGIFLTGSALNIYKLEPAVTRQIELMRAVYQSGTPCFGSCWGLQMGVVAAGGTVHLNPRGREVGFARKIAPTEAGLAHPLLAGRPRAFDAPAVHEDEVVVPPSANCTLLASNAVSQFQAVDISQDGGRFWGVQYHPEFSLQEVAAIMRRRLPSLTEEGFFASVEAGQIYVDELDALHLMPDRKDLAWKHGLDAQVLEPALRLTEISNFIAHLVQPTKSARLRA
jgi:GMP synthase (glutamine-hydrolysing)